jgi:hypothetical protein
MSAPRSVTSVIVGRVEEIPPGQRKLVVPFRGRAGIGVFNIDGAFYALRNLCPHKSGPLCTGFLSGRMVADAPPTTADEGGLRYADEGRIIRCPSTTRCGSRPTRWRSATARSSSTTRSRLAAPRSVRGGRLSRAPVGPFTNGPPARAMAR